MNNHVTDTALRIPPPRGALATIRGTGPLPTPGDELLRELADLGAAVGELREHAAREGWTFDAPPTDDE